MSTQRLFNRNFFLLWQGNLVSQLGSQGFVIALMFWLKHETGSATLMGLMMTVSMLPAVVLGPIAGTLADRYSRKRIIVFSDLFSGLAVLILYLAIARDLPSDVVIVLLFVASMALGAIRSFFNPAVSAAIPDIVPQDKVAAANGVEQSSEQISMFVGQALGGWLYTVLGAPALLLIDAVTYFFSAGSEAFITIPQKVAEQATGWRAKFREFLSDTKTGIDFVRNNRGLRALVIMATFLNFFLTPMLPLLPFYVEGTLSVSPAWYGYLLAALGAGALIGYGAASLLQQSGLRSANPVLVLLVLVAIAMTSLSIIRNAWVALLVMFAVGVFSGLFNILVMTLLQLKTATEIRGRIFGLLTTLTSGLTPLAMGLGGVAADLTGQNIPLIFAICGLTTVLLTFLNFFNRSLKQFFATEPVQRSDEVSQSEN